MAAQRDWFEKDYYKMLGVEQAATAKEITKSYRKLARDLPSRQEPRRRRRRGEVQGSRRRVRRARRRREAQGVRRGPPDGPDVDGRAAGVARAASGSTSATWTAASATCSAACSAPRRRRRTGRGPVGRHGAGPRRGADITAILTVDFKDAIDGLSTTLYLTADAQCSTCHGSGAKPGTQPTACAACGGRGVVDDNQGMFSFSSPCRVCGGSGVRIEEPCPTCSGTGVEKRQREVQTRLPAGVKDGQTIRLKGRGGPGRNGGPAGDLLVELTVTPHPRFARSGDNLTVTVPITFAEAALGADIDVPTLDGPASRCGSSQAHRPGAVTE